MASAWLASTAPVCATVRRHCDFYSESGVVYKYPDLLTYLRDAARNETGYDCRRQKLID